jgi:hypothetical protein
MLGLIVVLICSSLGHLDGRFTHVTPFANPCPYRPNHDQPVHPQASALGPKSRNYQRFRYNLAKKLNPKLRGCCEQCTALPLVFFNPGTTVGEVSSIYDRVQCGFRGSPRRIAHHHFSRGTPFSPGPTPDDGKARRGHLEKPAPETSAPPAHSPRPDVPRREPFGFPRQPCARLSGLSHIFI